MKKVLVLVMVVMLAAMLLVVVGCGADTAKAKEYMEEADAAYAKLETSLDELSTKSTALITAAMTGNYAAINAEDLAAVAEMTTKVAPEFESVMDKYNKIITECEDCPDYAEYADMMLKALEKDQQLVSAGAELLAKLQPVMESGDQAALEEALKSAQTEIANIQKMTTEVDNMFEEAQAFKEEKKLAE